MSEKPIAKKRMGNVNLAIWKKEYNGNTFYSYSFQVSKKNAEGGYDNFNSFGDWDLPALRSLIDYLIFKSIDKPAKKAEPKPEPEVTPVPPGDYDDIPF